MLQPPVDESIHAPEGDAISPIPTRVCIDREGRIKHIHFTTAFPER